MVTIGNQTANIDRRINMSEKPKPITRKIPPRLHNAVLEQYANGLKEVEIVEWLMREHEIPVSRSTINRLLTRVKKERNQVTQAVWVEAVAKTAVSDIEILAENTEILRKLRDTAVQDKNPSVAIKCASELKSHVALKMSISGVQTNSNDDEDKRRDFIDEILDDDDAAIVGKTKAN